jgi:pimeloyl-ACP methyl ester carboxylesterase
MLRLRSLISLLVLACSACPPSFAAAPVHPSRSRLAPCKVPGEKGAQIDAFCGIYQVWENRDAKAGRRIGLKVVVLPARSAAPLPDPVVYLSGGPGEASAGDAGFYAGSLLHQERDLVFIDHRGTGEPDKLSCHLGGDDLQSQFLELYPLDAVRRCRDTLGKTYDLARYTEAAAVDDFDEIRGWLGYGKVNLVGSSYGTRTAQIYLKRHPESVRTVTLWAVIPMDEPIPLSHAAGAQRSLDLVLSACEQDAACHAKFPAVRKDFQAVMDRLSQGPVEVEVADPETHKATRVRLSRYVIADGIRLVLYSSEAATALPLLIHQAAAGDWKPLGQTVVTAQAEIDRMLTRGLFFSVTCSQDIPFIDPAEIPGRTAGSFFGDYRVRRQIAACELWPHARIDPGEREAVHSGVPVLLINGERDVVTPPDFGRRAARFLTHSLRLVEPWASHEDAIPCVQKLGREFIRRGTTQGLDSASCLARVKPKPFLFELPKEGIVPFPPL